MGGATRLIVLLATPFSLLQPRLSRLRVARSSRFFPVSSPSCYRLSFSTAGSPKFHSQPVAIHDDHFSDNSLGALPSSHAPAPQPWPEWSKLVNSLAARGYFDGQRIVVEGDEFAFGNLPDEFVRTATAALNFSRDCPNLLRSLTRRDVAVVVENGTSFLFRGGDHSERKMRSFLGRGENVSEFDKAHTVDLMRFLLSYVGNRIASLEAGKVPNTELVETSVRNLLHELVSVNYYGSPESDISGPMQDQFLDRYGQGQRVSGQNIQMKRGDWICPRCNFMNFARNLKCLECEEMSPKSRLMEGGWECPQCDFSNYSRNTECLRCDCKRPEDASLNKSSSQLGLGESHMHKIDIDNHSTANEEKAARWFSKVSRARSNPDSNEDFFETMQSRKATDQVCTRRMNNSQYQRHSDCYGNFKEDNFENGVANKALDSKISKSLDEILRCTSTTSRTGYRNGNAGQDAQSETHPSLSASTSTRYVPSVSEGGEHVKSPVRWFQRIAEMHPESGVPSEGESSPSVGRENDHSLTTPMHKTHMNMEKPSNPTSGDTTNYFMGSGTYGNERRRGETCGAPTSGNGTHNFTGSSQLDAKGNWTGKSLEGSAVKEPPDPLDMSEEAKTERWFRRVAQIKDISELSQIPDEDFPSIMPMRKGVNRFVVSKRKTPLERRLTSPQYRKNLPVVSSDPVKKGDDGS